MAGSSVPSDSGEASTMRSASASRASESRVRARSASALLRAARRGVPAASGVPALSPARASVATVSKARTASVARRPVRAPRWAAAGTVRSNSNTVRCATRVPLGTGCARPTASSARIASRSAIHHRSIGSGWMVVASSIPAGRKRAVASVSARGRCPCQPGARRPRPACPRHRRQAPTARARSRHCPAAGGGTDERTHGIGRRLVIHHFHVARASGQPAIAHRTTERREGLVVRTGGAARQRPAQLRVLGIHRDRTLQPRR